MKFKMHNATLTLYNIIPWTSKSTKQDNISEHGEFLIGMFSDICQNQYTDIDESEYCKLAYKPVKI